MVLESVVHKTTGSKNSLVIPVKSLYLNEFQRTYSKNSGDTLYQHVGTVRLANLVRYYLSAIKSVLYCITTVQ